MLRYISEDLHIGLAKIIYIRCINGNFLAGKSPNIRSHMLYIYGYGQPYFYTVGKQTRRLMYLTKIASYLNYLTKITFVLAHVPRLIIARSGGVLV